MSRQLTYSVRVGIRPARKLSGDKSAELQALHNLRDGSSGCHTAVADA